MPPRPSYVTSITQTVIDFDAPRPAPAETNAHAKIAESAPAEYHTAPAWIDTAGRTRTWSLHNPHGTKVAEITTKSAALKLAALLNGITGGERSPAR